MSGSKLSNQDRKDLEKFTKFLIYKSLQIIVQSRLGEKISTKSKLSATGADWFNLAIKDISEVHNEAKKTLAGQKTLLGQSVCVEISLKTADGDTMILETWFISLNHDSCDPNVKVSYAVYNRMSIALKSLLSVSRVTPAYKLSRQQGADDFVICYKIYNGEPQFFMLGDDYKTAKVGSVPTPVGTININLAYRTKLLITPQKTMKEIPFEVKDDHFKKDNVSPKRPTTPKPCSLGYKRNESVADELCQGSDETQDFTFTNSPGDNILKNSQIPRSQPIGINNTSPRNHHDSKAHSNPEKQTSFTSYQKIGAFADNKIHRDSKSDIEDIPFLNLIQDDIKIDDKTVLNVKELSKSSKSRNDSCDSDRRESSSHASGDGEKLHESVLSNHSSISQELPPDDFVMVELKTPFAGADPNTDLGKFYRDFSLAPSLNMFTEEPTVGETLEQITDQLSMFESNVYEFDSFIGEVVESSPE
ncbi:autophagy-related protein 13-like [Mytilus galloprovincialis]|uniref:autophagy-related protein 13-like n=1 Tax=Mytilus edulis TaxID=6550 RepID=UPI0039EEBCB6